MLFSTVVVIYIIGNLLLALIVLYKSHKNLISKFYTFCVVCLFFMGFSTYLLSQPISNNLHQVLDQIVAFLYSVFPFFFLHFIVLFIRRHKVLRSRFVIPTIYFAGLFSFASILLGFIGGPITATGEITKSGHAFFLTWLSIFFTIGIAMLYEVARGFYDKPGKANVLFVCFVLLMLVLPGPFTESIFFNILHLDAQAYYSTCIVALVIAVYYIFRHKIIVNTLFDALKSALNVVNDLFITMDDSFRIEMARGNPVVSLLGYREQELLGRTFTDLIDRPDSIREYKSFVLQKKMKECYLDTHVLCKDLSQVMMNFSFSPSFNEDQLVGFVCVGRDIAERNRAEETVRRSEERYRTLFESAAEGILIADIETKKFKHANPAICKILGYSQEELVEMGVGDIHPKDSLEHVIAEFGAQARGEKTLSSALPCLRKDGKIIHADVNATRAIIDKRKCIIGFFADVTERKKVEKALIKLNKAIETSGEAIFLTDPEGIITYVNPGFTATYGYTADEVVGKDTPRILKSGTMRPDDYKMFWKTLMSEQEVRGELVNKRKDGKLINIEGSANPIFDEEKNIIGFLGIQRDITERKRAEEALRESETGFKTLFESANDGMFVYDLESRMFVMSNAACLRMLGFTPEEFLNMGLHDLHLPEDLLFISEQIRMILNGDESVRADIRFKRRDGSTFFTDINPTSILLSGRECILIIFRDITERKRAELETRERMKELRGLYNLNEISRREDTNIESICEEFTNVLPQSWQYTDIACARIVIGEKEFRTKNFAESAWTQSAPILMDKSAVGRIDVYYLEERPVLDEGPFLKEERQLIDALAERIGSIFQRKLADEKLLKSEEQFRLISENVADLIAVLDLEGRRVYTSPMYKNILGDPNELRGTDSFQEIHPDDHEKIKAIFKETVRTGIGQRTEYRFLNKDGKISHIESQGSVIRDKDGKITNVVVVSRDVTEKKQIEQQIMRMQRMESIGILAGGVAHDLNNVLAPIMLSIEILKKAMPDERSQRMLEAIETSAHRGAAIIKQILGFARGVQGAQAPIQFRHIINEITNIMKETFLKSIEIKEDIPKNIWTIVGDPTNLHQLMMNLCVNARDAMPDGGTIHISAENKIIDEHYSRMNLEAKPGRFVMLSVEDTGCGMPPAVLEHIFEPFFTTKEVGKGTGLGLSTVHAIVKSHGGFVNVYSEVGKGTIFKIYLPAAKETGEIKPKLEELKEMFLGNGELILVVDDESSIQQITKHMLEAHGYLVITASDGTEAITNFASRKEEIALVLTDIMMPIMDGTQTIKVLRKMKPALKIIASSGLTGDSHIVTDKGLGVDAFLVKPYNAEKLLETIYSVLHKQ